MPDPFARPYNPSHGNLARLANATIDSVKAQSDLVAAVSDSLGTLGDGISHDLEALTAALSTRLDNVVGGLDRIAESCAGAVNIYITIVIVFLVRGVNPDGTINRDHPLGALLLDIDVESLAQIANMPGDPSEVATDIVKRLSARSKRLAALKFGAPELAQIVRAARAVGASRAQAQ